MRLAGGGPRTVRVAVGALGVGLTVLVAPVAAADPVLPEPAPPLPLPVAAPAPVPVDVLAAAPGVPATPAAPLGPAPGPVPAAGTDPAPAALAPPDGASHLPSPDSLPPGTTQQAPPTSRIDYLRDMWNVLRAKEDITASDALMLLAQRPVNEQLMAQSVPVNLDPLPPAALPEAQPAAPVLAPEAPAAAPDAPAVPAENSGAAPALDASAVEPAPAPLPAAPAP